MWMFKRTFTCCPSNRLTTQILGLVPTLAHLACLRWKRRKVFPRSNVSVEKPTQRLLLSGKEWAFFRLLLWPLVISKQLGQFHFSASKWKTAWLQEVKRYTMHQTEDAFLGKYFFFVTYFLTHCNSWQPRNTIQKMKRGQIPLLLEAFCV